MLTPCGSPASSDFGPAAAAGSRTLRACHMSVARTDQRAIDPAERLVVADRARQGAGVAPSALLVNEALPALSKATMLKASFGQEPPCRESSAYGTAIPAIAGFSFSTFGTASAGVAFDDVSVDDGGVTEAASAGTPPRLTLSISSTLMAYVEAFFHVLHPFRAAAALADLRRSSAASRLRRHQTLAPRATRFPRVAGQ